MELSKRKMVGPDLLVTKCFNSFSLEESHKVWSKREVKPVFYRTIGTTIRVVKDTECVPRVHVKNISIQSISVQVKAVKVEPNLSYEEHFRIFAREITI
ncbi:Gag protease polyprotein [Gossypium australe]|uniref:Gag protease polyprotein n=1 Tax=Gossypium australe TaxID=47621 RepID=A0A5B6W9A5_9ROSI|nr:Gag protease polyprotein [Gossypium australe]